MNQKFVIVGGVAGGASTAARLRRLDEMAEIVLFEKGPNVSFSNCCLPYRLSNIVQAHEDLVLMNPEQFHNQYHIDARTNSQVTAINRTEQFVTVQTADGKTYNEPYDTLVLSPGANAIVPPIKGIETARTFVVKNVVDISRLYDQIHDGATKNITVVGGGFIGIETAENLVNGGYHVTVVEAMPQILRPYDYDMVQILEKEMLDHGVDLLVNEKVVAFQGSDAILESGKKVEGDAVVLAIGVRPDTKLAKDCGLELTLNGCIKVDENYRTTYDPHIYAVGDAIAVYNCLLQKFVNLPLAGPAQKEARAAADHIYGRTVRNSGFIGSSCIKVFDYNAASTGLTAAQCEAGGISYDIAYVIPQDKVGLMPGNYPLHYKLIFEVPTGRVLGAQAISKGEAAKRIDIVATLIKFGGTVDDLRDLELCYAPPYSTAKDAGNMAGLVAMNLMQKTFRQVPVVQVRELVETGAYIIDVREENEFAKGHIKTAHNIPLSCIRERLEEIPKDRPVYLHCRSSQRSYNACLALQGHGFTNIYNISGSFLGICMYEYFNDVTMHRDPIVTAYNFN